MTTAVIEQPKADVFGFERSVQVRPYETAKASVFIQADIVNRANYQSDEDYQLARLQALETAAVLGKSFVLDQLGLDFTKGADGIIREVFGGVVDVTPTETAPPVQTQPASVPPAQPPVQAPPTLADEPPFPPNTSDREQIKANRAWAKARWDAGLTAEFFDNRNDKRTDKSPDIKHKATGIAVWLS